MMLFEGCLYHHIPVICGPTASGKSELALSVCKEISGELVSCDSMQIYKGMDIGTAKASREEQREIPHHMIDIVDPAEEYNVSLFQKDAYRCIEMILQKRKIPVLCGGTGQYIQSLTLGLEFVAADENPEIKKKLEDEADRSGIGNLYERLIKIDPEAAKKIHPNNRKRVIRALEIFELTGIPMSCHNDISRKTGPRFPFQIFMLDKNREELYQRINSRVDRMLEAGLLAEVRDLYLRHIGTSPTASQGIGYKELFSYYKKEITLETAIEQIKIRSRHYAKRQITWFSHMDGVMKISSDDKALVLQTISK